MSATFIGITGNMGSGKSTVIDILASWGKMTFKADIIAKELLYGGQHDDEVAEILGHEIFVHDGRGFRIDYNEIRRIIVEDKKKREQLNAFASSIVWSEILRRVGDYDGFVYVETAILHEVGWNDGRFKLVVCVWCSEETALNRLLGKPRQGKPPLPEEQIRGLMAAQYSVNEKRCRSDICFPNTDEVRIESLEEYVRHLLSGWDPAVFETRTDPI